MNIPRRNSMKTGQAIRFTSPRKLRRQFTKNPGQTTMICHLKNTYFPRITQRRTHTEILRTSPQADRLPVRIQAPLRAMPAITSMTMFLEKLPLCLRSICPMTVHTVKLHMLLPTSSFRIPRKQSLLRNHPTVSLILFPRATPRCRIIRIPARCRAAYSFRRGLT